MQGETCIMGWQRTVSMHQKEHNKYTVKTGMQQYTQRMDKMASLKQEKTAVCNGSREVSESRAGNGQTGKKSLSSKCLSCIL